MFLAHVLSKMFKSKQLEEILTPVTKVLQCPCPSPTPGACSDSCTLSWWCHPKFPFFVVPFSSYLQSFPASGFFLKIQLFPSGGPCTGACFSISLSNEYLGLISFRTEWFDLLAVHGTVKSLLQHISKALLLWHSASFYGPTLTSIHDYWKNHSFDYTDLCWQSDVSAC